MTAKEVSPDTKIPRRGKTLREVAEGTGLSKATIARWTSEPREQYLERARHKCERVQELRGQGLSIRAIARETGYSVGTVHRYVSQMKTSA